MYGQGPGQGTDPLGDFNFDALLAELGPLPGGSSPGRQGTSKTSSPGNLGSAISDISKQTGPGSDLNLEAAINDITKELEQNFAADPSLQGLMTGNSGDFSNFDALFKTFGSEATGTANANALGKTGGGATPSGISSDLLGFSSGNNALPGGQSFSTPNSGTEGMTMANILGQDTSNFGGDIPKSLTDALTNIGGSQSAPSQNSVGRSENSIVEQNKGSIQEMSFPSISELSSRSSGSAADTNELTNSFPHDLFTQTVNSQPASPQTANTGSARSDSQTKNTPFPAATFEQSRSPFTAQLPDLNFSPDANNNLIQPDNRGAGRDIFAQSRPPVPSQIPDFDSRNSFVLPDNSEQQTPPSQTKKLQNLSPSELRRALAEVNKEIDKLSAPLQNRQNPGTPNEPARMRSSRSQGGLELGSIAQRFTGRTGADTSFTNAFELPQSRSPSPVGLAGSTPSAESAAQDPRGPEGQQFVSGVSPQIDPLNAIQSVGEGIPLGVPPAIQRFPGNFGNQFIGQGVPIPGRGGGFQNPLTPSFIQNRGLPGGVQTNLPPNFINPNRLDIPGGRLPRGPLRSGLPGRIFNVPNTGSVERSNRGFNEREFQFGQTRGRDLSPDNRILRGRVPGNRQQRPRNPPRERQGGNRSLNRDVNSILNSVREQRSRDRNPFDFRLTRHSSDSSRRRSTDSRGRRRLRLNGVTIRQHRPSDRDRHRRRQRGRSSPSARRQNFRLWWS